MPVPQASEDFYKALQRFQLLLLASGRRQWARMLPDNFDLAWRTIAPTLVTLTSAAQLAAATAATRYVPAVLDEQGLDAPAEAQVKPGVFAGVAYDGRPLDTLLEGAVRTAKARVATGLDPDAALRAGGSWLDTALQTIVSDAARDATATDIATRPRVGWVRMVNPPCCSRCAVLAGKFYAFSTGFLRHPRCDCVHIPTTENRAGDYTTNPRLLVERGLVTDLTAGQRKRLDGGSDLVKVLNESRDAWRARMAVERKAAKRRAAAWGTNTPTPLPPGGIQDFLSHLTSRVDAINELKRRGIAA